MCWGSLQRSQTSLAGFKGPTSKGRGGHGKGGEGREGDGRERKGTGAERRKGKERVIPVLRALVRPWLHVK